MSRNSVLVLLLCLGMFGAWQHFSGSTPQASQGSVGALSPSSSGTVVVYGRDNCSYTQRMLAYLRSNNVPVTYVNIDYTDASNAFHSKFDGTNLAGDRGYALPVVEISGRASTRPDPIDVAHQFRRTQ